MSFKIAIDGLKDIRKAISIESTIADSVPEISEAILGLHRTLERRVATLYTLEQPLSSVMIGKNKPLEAIGKTFFRYNLQYRYKPVLLSEYSHRILYGEDVELSAAPLRIPKGDPLARVKWSWGYWSEVTEVQVRKGSEYKIKGQPAFTYTSNGKQIVSHRTKKQTWNIRPAKGRTGNRTNRTTVLFGPSLASLAESVYNNDGYVQEAIEQMYDDILTAYTRHMG